MPDVPGRGVSVDFRRFYDAYWAEKDDSYDRSRLALITSRIPSGAEVLEVGCGPGILGHLLGEKGVWVAGADLSPVALRRAAAQGVRAVWCETDGRPLPFRDGVFHWAASNSSLEHLYHVAHAVREIHRILAPGGVFLWMVPNIGLWRFRMWLLFGRFPVVENSATDPLHIRMFTAREAKALLRRAGFRVRRVTGSAGTWVPRLFPWWLRLPGVRHLYEGAALLYPSLLCRYLLLEAEKTP